MKRKVFFFAFILFVQLRIWGTEFILSDSNKKLLEQRIYARTFGR